MLLSAATGPKVLVNRTGTMNLSKVTTPCALRHRCRNAALAVSDVAGGGELVIPRDGWNLNDSTGLALTGTTSPIRTEAEAWLST